MTVRIPSGDTNAPLNDEFSIARDVFGLSLDALADKANNLIGYRWLKCVPVIVAPYRAGIPDPGEDLDDWNPLPAEATNTVHIPFTTSALTNRLFVALGYSRLAEDAEVTVSAYESHITIVENGNPLDPGFQWLEASGHLPQQFGEDPDDKTPLRHLVWVGNGSDVGAVDSADPVTTKPRLLQVTPSTEVEVKVTWNDKIKVNSVCVWEVFRGFV